MDRSMKARTLLVLEILVLAAVYYLCGRFGLSLAFLHKSASAVWPPTGLALAALLLRGTRLWPGVFIGAFCVNYHVQASVPTSLAIASGNTLEAILGMWLVTRFAGGLRALETTRNLFRFVLLAAMLSTLVSPTLGVTSLCLGHLAEWNNYLSIWLVWWLGDMVSNFIIAPLLIIWLGAAWPRPKLRELFEATGLLAMLVVV